MEGSTVGAFIASGGAGGVTDGVGDGFGVIAAGTACISYQPIYDDAGNYLGSNPVNVCQ